MPRPKALHEDHQEQKLLLFIEATRWAPKPGTSNEEGAILLIWAPRKEPDHLVSPLQSGSQTMGNREMESSLLS